MIVLCVLIVGMSVFTQLLTGVLFTDQNTIDYAQCLKHFVMLNMSSQIENIVSAYKTLIKIPSVVGGRLNNAGNRVSSKWSIRNLDKGKPTKFSYNYLLDENLGVTSESEFGGDVSNELLSAVSPKETFKAVIREEKDAKDAKKQYLEIWSQHCLAHSIDLTALDIHGDVYADSEFGSLDWSQDESSVVYVAERKLKKSEPYIKRKGEEKKSDGSGEAAPTKGEEYVYRQDWGEQLVGKYLSVIVVCRIDSETLTVLEGLPEGHCPGQVRFSPDGKSVVGVAWETEPRRLGLIYCTNRPSYIFQLTLDGQLSKLSPAGSSVRSPRLAPGGALLWLQRAADGLHHACHALIRRKTSGEVSPIIDIVQTETKIANDVSFYGVYCQKLPNHGFSNDGKRLCFSTEQQNEVRSYVVDTDGGRIVDISNRSAPQSTSILDVKNDVILAACSNLTTPGQLYAARLPPQGQESEIKWVRISKPTNVPATVAEATVQYLDLEHEGSTDSVKSFTAIYMAPKSEGKKLPLVVWPHGGPHSSFANAYSLDAALMAMLGFASVQVNYRGSVGAGQASVYFLPKRVGDTDVKDCKLATDATLRAYPIDEKRVCLRGGSHGGFLVTHLSGQYPDVYAACVASNPVIDVATMFNSTDIPDWCAAEAGFEFSERGPVSEDHLLAMRRCSPLAYVHQVKAPTAMMLGSGDKRVPHYQGLEYARRLKANGVKTRVYMYDDNHSLSSQSAEMDNLINGVAWLLEHLQA